MVTMAQVQALVDRDEKDLDSVLLPMDTALGEWPAVRLSTDSAFYVRQGQPVQVPQAPTAGMVRLYEKGDVFLGVGEIIDDGRVAPRRILRA
jgi:tRNA pseudouridine55 synthase